MNCLINNSQDTVHKKHSHGLLRILSQETYSNAGRASTVVSYLKFLLSTSMQRNIRYQFKKDQDFKAYDHPFILGKS